MASRDNPKTILLRGAPAGREGKAGGTITPGMLLTVNSSGAIVAHATAGAAANAWFARENELVGKTIDGTYASGDTVLYWSCKPGDQIYALLETGANVAVGALLQSNGLGAFEPAVAASQAGTEPFAVTFPGTPIVRALEAVNNSSGANARIRVEVL